MCSVPSQHDSVAARVDTGNSHVNHHIPKSTHVAVCVITLQSDWRAQILPHEGIVSMIDLNMYRVHTSIGGLIVATM